MLWVTKSSKRLTYLLGVCFRFALQGSLHLTKVTSWVKLWAAGSLTQNTSLKITYNINGRLMVRMFLLLLNVKMSFMSFPDLTRTYFCWVSPARMRILWTSTSLLSVSPDHQEETIFSMLEADQPFVSSHLNFSINKSPISFSVTSRNECVLFGAIFSFLPKKRSVSGRLLACKNVSLTYYLLSHISTINTTLYDFYLIPYFLLGNCYKQLIWLTRYKSQHCNSLP